MYRKYLTTALLVSMATAVAAPVSAQTVAANSHNPAIKSSAAVSVAAPAHGATSFTRNQARGRLAKAGYTNLSHLTKDPSGAWMGSAMKDGHSVNVALDYKGNVTTR